MNTDYDEEALLTARNKIVTAHLALHGLAERVDGPQDEILSVERVLDEAMRDLNRGLNLDAG
jgi:hypothetical protein